MLNILLILIGIVGVAGLVIVFGLEDKTVSTDTLFTLSMAVCALSFVAIASNNIDVTYLNRDWNEREVLSERDATLVSDNDRLKKAYANKRVWAIMDRENWAIGRGFTLQEAQQKRKDMLEKAFHNSRLMLEIENK